MTVFIYCFECISLCKVQGKKYIGSTNNLKNRYRWHLNDFKNKTHHNPELMKWYNKPNIKFNFYILEKVQNEADRFKREQFYINKYINSCFNLVDVNGEFLKKEKFIPLNYLRLNKKRSNKKQRTINKFIKTSKQFKKKW